MLERLKIMDADLAAIEDLKLIYVAVASVPTKNFSGVRNSPRRIPDFYQPLLHN